MSVKDVMNYYALTLDVDWAPGFIIESVAEMLLANSIKCTWFVTNSSPAIEKLFIHKTGSFAACS